MGTYRLLLAYTVAAYHMNVTLPDIQIGVTAVISFFVISGFVMTALMQRNYGSVDRIPAFYADRAMRILPQFWLYIVLMLVVMGLGIARFEVSISACNLGRVVENFLVVPLQFGWVNELWMCTILPQTWSLGLEVLFYIIFPFLIILGLRWPVFVASISLFAFAYSGFFVDADADWHGYRLLPGTIFIFLIGSFIYTKRDRVEALVPWAVSAAAAVLVILQWYFPAFQQSLSLSVLLGVATSIPAVALLSRFRFSAWDDLAGSLSYGIFLNHIMINLALPSLQIGAGSIWARMIIVLALSTALAFATYWIVERPIVEFRRRARRQKLDRVTSSARLQQAS